MNKIKVNDREFLYEVKRSESGQYRTLFYDVNPVKKYVKKYILFGPIIEKETFKELFRLYINIELPIYAKVDIREKIQEKIILLNRKKEIERGEIV